MPTFHIHCRILETASPLAYRSNACYESLERNFCTSLRPLDKKQCECKCARKKLDFTGKRNKLKREIRASQEMPTY